MKDNVDIVPIELNGSGTGPRALWGNMNQLRKYPGSLIHITGDVHYAGLLSIKPVIITIHDVNSILNRGFLKRVFLKLFWFWLPALRATQITVISEFSKKALCEIIPYAKKKITVIPNPVNPVLVKVEKEFNNIKPIILHIGTKTNKNLERTIEAISTINCELIIIGELNTSQEGLLLSYKIDYQNEAHIPYESIKYYYEICDLVSFVSLYEGFGMPIIEAQKVGRPVITSNLASIPEVAGNGALLVNPYDIEEIRNGVCKIIENKEFRRNLIERGFVNAERYKIERISNLYLSLYSEILG